MARPHLFVNLDRMEYISSLEMGSDDRGLKSSDQFSKFKIACHMLISNDVRPFARLRSAIPTSGDDYKYLEAETVNGSENTDFGTRVLCYPRSATVWCGDRVVMMGRGGMGADKLRLAEHLEAEFEMLRVRCDDPQTRGNDHYQFEKHVSSRTTPHADLYLYITGRGTNISQEILKELRVGGLDIGQYVEQCAVRTERLRVVPASTFTCQEADDPTQIDLRLVSLYSLTEALRRVASKEELHAAKKVLRANKTLTAAQRSMLALLGYRDFERELYVTNRAKWSELWDHAPDHEAAIPSDVVDMIAKKAAERQGKKQADPRDWLTATLSGSGKPRSQRRLIDME